MSVRLEEKELAALRRAAADDQRPVAAMARLMIHAGLKLRGYLDDEPAPEASAPALPAAEREPAPPRPQSRRK